MAVSKTTMTVLPMRPQGSRVIAQENPPAVLSMRPPKRLPMESAATGLQMKKHPHCIPILLAMIIMLDVPTKRKRKRTNKNLRGKRGKRGVKSGAVPTKWTRTTTPLRLPTVLNLHAFVHVKIVLFPAQKLTERHCAVCPLLRLQQPASAVGPGRRMTVTKNARSLQETVRLWNDLGEIDCRQSRLLWPIVQRRTRRLEI